MKNINIVLLLLPILIGLNAGLGNEFYFINFFGNLNIIDLVIVALLLIFIIFNRINLNPKLNSTQIFFLLLLIGFFQLLSILVNNTISLQNLGEIFRIFYYAAIVLISLPLVSNNKKFILFLIYGFLFGITLNIGYSFYLWNLIPRFYNGFPFLNNELINRNTIYYYMVITIPFSIFMIMNSKKIFSKFLFLLFLILITVTAILTLSKGAWLLLFLVIFPFYVLKIMKKSIFFFAPIFLLFLVFLLGNSYIEKLFTAFDTLQLQNFDIVENQRLNYKFFAIETGLNNLFFGIGLGRYKLYTILFANHPPTSDPHDAALMLFAEGGLIVFISYIFIQIKSILNIYSFQISTKINFYGMKNNFIINFQILKEMFIIIFLILGFLTGIVFTSKLFPFFLLIIFSANNSQKNFDSF